MYLGEESDEPNKKEGLAKKAMKRAMSLTPKIVKVECVSKSSSASSKKWSS